jgi:hypothetical protein
VNARPFAQGARTQAVRMAAKEYPEFAARTDAFGIRQFNRLVGNLAPLLEQDMRIAAARRAA